MKLNNRLKKITEFIDDNSFILDVGCDHALLDIYLVKNRKNINCIASDINNNPLIKAKDNIEKYNITGITLINSDGISSLTNNINYIVISGMGGRLITNIILKNLNKITSQTIILSPNNDYCYVRKVLNQNGLELINEVLVEDKYIYEILIFKKGKHKLNKEEISYGKFLKDDILYKKYCLRQLDTLIKIKNSLPKKYLFKKVIINKKIRDIKNII